MKPRIAVCGIHIESSTFTPYMSDVNDFVVTRGEEILARYSWLSYTWAQAVEWIGLLHARAIPGGVVKASAYQAWKTEIIAGLKNLVSTQEIDGLFFDIHGAMSVEGIDDAEGDLISAIRAVIGAETFVGASMDLHGNVSETLFDLTDMLTCYRMAPHEDAYESRMRAAQNLVNLVLAPKHNGKRVRPAKAIVHVPVLLPGEKTSTRLEPAASLYGQIPVLAARPGVTDVSIWIGFAWADQPRCKAAIAAYGSDAKAVETVARQLALDFWNQHEAFEFVAPTGSFKQCLEAALIGEKPFFISDSGDNPGAGGADDVTYALAQLLQWEPVIKGQMRAIYASLVDPQSVKIARAAGIGATVSLSVGGKIDTRSPGTLSINAIVVAMGTDPRGGQVVALESNGVTFILTEQRHQYAEAISFSYLGLDPRDFEVVVVKIGYLEPDIYAMAKGWWMALTPGGVDQDLLRLGHKRISRPMYPFDTDFDPLPFNVRH